MTLYILLRNTVATLRTMLKVLLPTHDASIAPLAVKHLVLVMLVVKHGTNFTVVT